MLNDAYDPGESDITVTTLIDSPRIRSMKINGDEIDFTGGFNDLHTESYRQILQGKGFRLDDALPSIELTHKIKMMT